MPDPDEGVGDGPLHQQAVFDLDKTPPAQGEKADHRAPYLKPRAHAVAFFVPGKRDGLRGNAQERFSRCG